LFVELYIQVENFALAEPRRGRGGRDHPPRVPARRAPDYRRAGHRQPAKRGEGDGERAK
jgi:hypothetical protein